MYLRNYISVYLKIESRTLLWKFEYFVMCLTFDKYSIISYFSFFFVSFEFAFQVGEGVTKLLIHPLEPLIFAGTVDGVVRCLDLRSGDAVKEFTGP